MSYDLKRVKEGLAMVKIANGTEHLWSDYYTASDVEKIMKYVEYKIKEGKYILVAKGEKILNDGQ